MSSTNPGPATTTTTNLVAPMSNLYKLETISVALTPAAVAQGTTAEQTFSGLSSGIKAGDFIVGVSKPTTQAGLAVAGWRVDATTDDKFYLTFANIPNAGGNITPTAGETYAITVARAVPGSTPITAVV